MTPDTYHHGNLQRALMDEALAVIGEQGVDRLSLRDVAARLGVSHAAPYHHFRDKGALLWALSREGWALLDERMSLAEQVAGDDAEQRLLGLGMAYVTFAVERPDYYAAFSAPEIVSTGRSGPPEDANHGVWGRLLSAVLACQKAGYLPQADPVILGVYLWSLVHGMAELWRGGGLTQMPQAKDGLEPLARQVLLAGLGSVTQHTR